MLFRISFTYSHFQSYHIKNEVMMLILLTSKCSWDQVIYIHACMHAYMHTYIHTFIHKTSTLVQWFEYAGPWEMALLGGVALLEEVWNYGRGLWDPPPSCLKTVFSCLPLKQGVELSAPPVPCLPGHSHAPALIIMDITSEPVSQLQLIVVLYKSCFGHGVSSQQ
jgi:hypothetical protein